MLSAFKKTNFDILHGELRFASSTRTLDPRLDIVGESTATKVEGDEDQVQLAISGTIMKPEVSFSSAVGCLKKKS